MCKPENIRASIWLDRRVYRQLRQVAAITEETHGQVLERLLGAEVLRLRSKHPEWVVEEVAASTD